MPSKTAREKWNAEHYTHINIAIDKSLAEKFKTMCSKNGISVAGAIGAFMRGRCDIEAKPDRLSKETASAGTRAWRRRQVYTITARLEEIRDAEETYLDRIPENLQGSIRAEDAAHSISMLSEAIDILNETY